VRPRPASPLALLRSPLVWWALLLVGSCLNPQPDPFPQAAGTAPGADRNAPSNPNGNDTFAGDESGATMSTAPAPAAGSGTPEVQTAPVPVALPPAAPGASGELDAGVPEPDGGQPDAAPAVNDAF